MRLSNERGSVRGSHGKEVPRERDVVISASTNASLEVRRSRGWPGMGCHHLHVPGKGRENRISPSGLRHSQLSSDRESVKQSCLALLECGTMREWKSNVDPGLNVHLSQRHPAPKCIQPPGLLP